MTNKLNYKLKEGELQELEKLLSEIENYKRVSIDRVTIKDSMMVIILHDPESKIPQRNLEREFELELMSAEDAVKERDYLKQEYEYEYEIGQHWDNLRWNVSKFFLSIQTVFVIVALKGLYELVKTVKETDPPSAITLINKPLVVYGLIVFAVINIILCIIWWLRNAGIHTWHRAAIKRQRLIELDPRWKHMPWFNSGVDHFRKSREGLLCKFLLNTGELECWGPPLAFGLLWLGIINLACFISWQPIIKSITQIFL